MPIPKTVNIPAAWLGSDMESKRYLWEYELSSQDLRELETAAEIFKKSKKPLGVISKSEFSLPNLSSFLEDLQKELRSGIGFKLIHGLPVEKYDAETRATIFCGIGSHLGSARSQNAQGHLLGHVRDVGADVNDPKSRIYQTTARQSFHTDSCDVVGLLCLKEAKEGGDSMLASSVAAYNHISKFGPELAAALFEPVSTDRRGEIPEGGKPFFTIPVFNWHDDKLSCIYQRNYIDSAQRYNDAPKLSALQKEALDFFDKVVNRPSFHLKMRLKPGDMQFVYNHSLLHDRTEFKDWDDPKEKRHLLRLWLALPKDRILPPIYMQRYGNIDVGDRGGVITNETVLHVPMN